MKYLIKILVLILLTPWSLFASDNEQEKIGIVLGAPIYRNQISESSGHKLHRELHSLFTRPILKNYMEKQKIEFKPSQNEINQFVSYYQRKHEEKIRDKKEEMLTDIEHIKVQLDNTNITPEERENLELDLMTKQMDLEGPGKRFAMFVLPHWKMQIHFYNNFGGGRLLWQQRGIEAFDAMHTWLKTQEKNGLFEIFDKSLKNSFYHYWTKMDHGSFITEDKERIHDFLNPEWKLPK